MEISDVFRLLFATLPYKIPVAVVLIGAIVFCFVNFSKYSKINTRVLIGLFILLATEFLSVFVPILNFYLIRTGGAESLKYISFFIGTLFSLGFAIGLGVILSAVWINRTPEKL